MSGFENPFFHFGPQGEFIEDQPLREAPPLPRDPEPSVSVAPQGWLRDDSTGLPVASEIKTRWNWQQIAIVGGVLALWFFAKRKRWL